MGECPEQACSSIVSCKVTNEDNSAAAQAKVDRKNILKRPGIHFFFTGHFCHLENHFSPKWPWKGIFWIQLGMSSSYDKIGVARQAGVSAVFHYGAEPANPWRCGFRKESRRPFLGEVVRTTLLPISSLKNISRLPSYHNSRGSLKPN